MLFWVCRWDADRPMGLGAQRSGGQGSASVQPASVPCEVRAPSRSHAVQPLPHACDVGIWTEHGNKEKRRRLCQ